MCALCVTQGERAWQQEGETHNKQKKTLVIVIILYNVIIIFIRKANKPFKFNNYKKTKQKDCSCGVCSYFGKKKKKKRCHFSNGLFPLRVCIWVVRGSIINNPTYFFTFLHPSFFFFSPCIEHLYWLFFLYTKAKK